MSSVAFPSDTDDVHRIRSKDQASHILRNVRRKYRGLELGKLRLGDGFKASQIRSKHIFLFKRRGRLCSGGEAAVI